MDINYKNLFFTFLHKFSFRFQTNWSVLKGVYIESNFFTF